MGNKRNEREGEEMRGEKGESYKTLPTPVEVTDRRIEKRVTNMG